MSSTNNLPAGAGQSAAGNVAGAKNVLGFRHTALKPVGYTARVTTLNPIAFVLLVDQSASMSQTITDNQGANQRKSEHLAQMINQFIGEIILTCQRSEGVKNYFELLLVGYGQENKEGESIVTILWEGPLDGKTWVTVEELKKGALKTEIVTKPNPSKFGKKLLEQTVQVWLEPRGEGLTPMKQAIDICTDHLSEWVRSHPESFPPLVFNVTDGYVTDIDDLSELALAASGLKGVCTNDGAALFFNCLLSDSSDEQKAFPLVSDRELFEENEYHLALFDSSSLLPQNLKRLIHPGIGDDQEVKGLILEAKIESVIRFLNIGTYTLQNNLG